MYRQRKAEEMSSVSNPKPKAEQMQSVSDRKRKAEDSDSDSASAVILCRWRYPPAGWVCLNTDGSVVTRGKISNGYCGGLVRDDKGRFLRGFSVNFSLLPAGIEPDMKVVMAELHGVKHGLDLAWSIGRRYVKLDIDSTDALDLLMDCPADDHPAFKLVSEIAKKLGKKWFVEYSHTYRESNRAADYFATQARLCPRYADAGVTYFTEPPPPVVSILEDDVAGNAIERVAGNATKRARA